MDQATGFAAADPAAMLTTQQAAELLGCQRRTVRKYIARGELDAAQDEHGTYAIARGAVDDLRRRQQGLSGEVVDSAPLPADRAPVPGGQAVGLPVADTLARQEQLLERLRGTLEAVQAALAHDRAAALEAQLAAAHEREHALARENGRLQAELAHAQAALLPAPAALPAQSSEGRSWSWGRLFGWMQRL